MAYQSFNTTRHKIVKIEQSQKDARVKLTNENIINVTLRPASFIKPIISIALLEKYFIPRIPSNAVQVAPDNVYNLVFFFDNLSDELMLTFKFTPTLYSTTAHKNVDLSTYVDLNYLWERVDKVHYKLYFYASAKYLVSNEIPIYLDLNLYFQNPSNYIER